MENSEKNFEKKSGRRQDSLVAMNVITGDHKIVNDAPILFWYDGTGDLKESISSSDMFIEWLVKHNVKDFYLTGKLSYIYYTYQDGNDNVTENSAALQDMFPVSVFEQFQVNTSEFFIRPGNGISDNLTRLYIAKYHRKPLAAATMTGLLQAVIRDGDVTRDTVVNYVFDKICQGKDFTSENRTYIHDWLDKNMP